MKMKAKILLFLMFIYKIIFPQDITLISEGFDNGTIAPQNWVFYGLGGTYTSTGNFGTASPSLKFDGTGDYIETPNLTKPKQVSFWCKGQGTDANSYLTVFQLISGTYQKVADLKPIPTTSQTITYSLDTNATKVKFVYTKSAGNLAFDDVLITGVNPSSGGGGTPVINMSKDKIFVFAYIGSSSDIKNYQVSATDVSTNLTISAPTNIYLSLDGISNWANTLQLTPTSGSIPNTTIYFKFSPTIKGNNTVYIQHSSGTTTKNLTCNVVAGDTSNPFKALKGNYKGKTLRYLLHNLIKNHTNIGYDGLWNQFIYSDSKENGKVWDIYTDIPSGTPTYQFDFITKQCGTYTKEGDCYNREHSWPKSWFNDLAPAYSDLHHIYPTDGYVNNRRADYVYSNVTNPTYTSSNGSKLGTSIWSGFSGTAFEPRNEFKGDLARTFFYMSTRYIYEDDGWASSEATSKAEILPWAVSLFLNWNSNDPVNQKEIVRNCAVKNVQNNWNPFILEPAFAREIWDTTTAPVVLNAESINNSDIIVTFDRYVDLISSQNVNNYYIEGIGNPYQAIRGYQGNPSKVLLKFNNLLPGNSYTLTINNITNLNGNPIANNSQINTGSILPVDLLSFNAYQKDNLIIIKWITLAQLNVDKFIIQKSIDKINWYDITSIKAKGNTNSLDEYIYKDISQNSGTYYYRLKIIDFDGSYKLSNEIKVNFDFDFKFSSKIYPNPFNPNANIEFYLPQDALVDINVYDMLGSKIQSICTNMNYKKGMNIILFNGNNLPSGNYIFEIKAKNQEKTFIHRHKILFLK